MLHKTKNTAALQNSNLKQTHQLKMRLYLKGALQFFFTGLTQKSSEVAVIHELPLRQIRFLREFCVSPISVVLNEEC